MALHRLRGRWLSCALVAAVTLVAPSILVAGDADWQPPLIHVPAGFELEVAAAPPLVGYPMMACFDDRGRLFIAESDGQNLEKDDLLRQQPRFIRLLEDVDGDGCFDKSTIFADKMTMPEGALWLDGALFVLSAPYLWRLEDTDGDGVADKREQLVGAMEFDGRPNQHGPYLGADGRLYFSGGTFGYDLVGKDGVPAGGSKSAQAGVFSCRRDGTQAEIVAQGCINPVELAFTGEGDMLGTCAILDRVDGRHDALMHWLRGGMTPELPGPPQLQDTGFRLPALVRWGQVAPAGLVRCRGPQFGSGPDPCLFACQFNTHQVQRVKLVRDGSTYRADDEAFLVSPSSDFHPTDVLEDADGSLLVIDTGGWVSWGCPLSQVAKPEIPGAIYRIRRSGAPQVDDPWGLQLAWNEARPAELIDRLDDARFAVRSRAIEVLGHGGPPAIAASRRALASSSPRVRRNAVWALARIDAEAARDAVRSALDDSDSTVRQAAAQVSGTVRDRKAVGPLCAMLAGDEAPIRREAATALGRIGSAASAPALLEALSGDNDQFLSHALTYALIEIDDHEATVAGLSHASPQVQRAALVALDQMHHGRLTEELVVPLAAADDAALRQAAMQVITSRPGWSDQVVGYLEKFLRGPVLDDSQRLLIQAAMLAFSQDERVQLFVAAALDEPATSPNVRSELLDTISRLAHLPEAWIAPLARLLSAGDAQVRRQAVATIARFDASRFDVPLQALGRDRSQPAELRSAAWAALAASGAALDAEAFDLLVNQIHDPDTSPLDRLAAARSLASATLNESQLEQLTAAISGADLLVLPALLSAFERSPESAAPDAADAARDGDLGLRLVRALEQSPGLANLPAARLQALVDRYPAEVRAAAEPLIRRLSIDDGQSAARLVELAAQLAPGDTERGRAAFFGAKAACSACHQVQGQGGQVGPDLSNIGQIRTRRDLLEAIVLPSATLVNGYETHTVITTGGQTHTGWIQRETADTIVLRNAERQAIVVPRSEIDELQPGNTSIMPQGLDKTLTIEQLSDVVAYLRSLRPPGTLPPDDAESDSGQVGE